MGASYFVVMGVGESPVKVFNNLTERALVEYGNDCYNGTIATTSLRGRLATKWGNKATLTQAELKKLYDYLNSDIVVNKINKRECYYENAGCNGYAEYTMMFDDCEGLTSRKGYMVTAFDAKGNRISRTYHRGLPETKKVAKELAFGRAFKGSVVIELAEGNIQKAVWKPKLVRETKRSIKPKNEKHWVQAKNRYYFFGWAAE